MNTQRIAVLVTSIAMAGLLGLAILGNAFDLVFLPASPTALEMADTRAGIGFVEQELLLAFARTGLLFAVIGLTALTVVAVATTVMPHVPVLIPIAVAVIATIAFFAPYARVAPLGLLSMIPFTAFVMAFTWLAWVAAVSATLVADRRSAGGAFAAHASQ